MIAEIGLEQGSYTVGEGAGSLEVCVSSQRVDRVVEVTLSTEDGTAVGTNIQQVCFVCNN